MAFREFRYRDEALPGLASLAAAGVPFEELRQRIALVMAGSRPAARDGSQHVVPFHGHYLVFVASTASPSTLVLAAVEKQPP
jgi:hypothetical protein